MEKDGARAAVYDCPRPIPHGSPLPLKPRHTGLGAAVPRKGWVSRRAFGR